MSIKNAFAKIDSRKNYTNSVLIPEKDTKPQLQTTAPYAVEEHMTARGNT